MGMKKSIFFMFLSITTIATFITVSALPNISADAIYVDKTCQQIPLSQPRSIDGFEIDYQFAFTTAEQSYLLYAARYQDGAYIFCVSKPNYLSPQVIRNEKINFQFIDNIVQPEKGKPTFIVTVRNGNGRNPSSAPVRLDLKNPKNPIVTSN